MANLKFYKIARTILWVKIFSRVNAFTVELNLKYSDYLWIQLKNFSLPVCLSLKI